MFCLMIFNDRAHLIAITAHDSSLIGQVDQGGDMCRGLRPACSGRPCREQISATGWGTRGSGQFAESALDTLYVARNRG
jgi:hypothetical protein